MTIFKQNLDIQTCTAELLSAPSGSEWNCAKLLMSLWHHSICLTRGNLKSPRLIVLLRDPVLDNNENVAHASDNLSEEVFLIYIAWSLTNLWSVRIFISPWTENLFISAYDPGTKLHLGKQKGIWGGAKIWWVGGWRAMSGCCVQESLSKSGDMLVNSVALSKCSSSDRHSGNWHWQSDLGGLIQGAQPIP